MTDILLVSLGTTGGLRAADDALAGSLQRAGAEVAVARAPVPMHGKLSRIHHRGEAVFRGIDGPFEATRYHSLIVDRASLPKDLAVTAETDDGLVMGVSHRTHPVHGVQFHPESILSEHGTLIIQNFLDLAAAWNARRAA